MRNKDEKLLAEAYTKIYLKEEVPSEYIDNALKDTFNSGRYTDFVSKLSRLAKDSKVQAVLNAGINDEAPQDEQLTWAENVLPVNKLIPTQNEIDIGKSLSFPLKDVKSFVRCFVNGLTINNMPLVTADNKYIIDGHHRWSQVYAINPNATMKVINLTFPAYKDKPLDYLKIVQTAIAATIGKVPVSTVDRAEGVNNNLLSMPEENIKNFVIKKISPEVEKYLNTNQNIQKQFFSSQQQSQAAENLQLEAQPQQQAPVQPQQQAPAQQQSANNIKVKAADQIVKNSQKMRQIPKVPGAPPRNFMPQTDDAGKPNDPNSYLSKLKAGAVNFHQPKFSDLKKGTQKSTPVLKLKEPALKSKAVEILKKSGIDVE